MKIWYISLDKINLSLLFSLGLCIRDIKDLHFSVEHQFVLGASMKIFLIFSMSYFHLEISQISLRILMYSTYCLVWLFTFTNEYFSPGSFVILHDEDILPTDTRIPPTTQHAEQVIEGSITRAWAHQLNHQVNLFLRLLTNVYKNKLLFNYCDDFIVLRNQREEPHKPKYISRGKSIRIWPSWQQ